MTKRTPPNQPPARGAASRDAQRANGSNTPLNPGAMLHGLDATALDAHRAARVNGSPTPVAVLLDAGRRSLALPPGHARRRDLAWDLVNAGVTLTRWCSIVALAEYTSGGSEHHALNRALLDSLRLPADGTWRQLLAAPKDLTKDESLLAVLGRRANRRAPELSAFAADGLKPWFADVPFGKDAAPGLPTSAPTSVDALSEVFTSFRNKLTHGDYVRQRPSDATLDVLAALLDRYVEALWPILARPVVVRSGGALLLARGLALSPPSPRDALDLTLVDANTLPEGTAAWLDASGTPLSLTPWIAVSDLRRAYAASMLAAGARDADLAAADDEPELLELGLFNRFEREVLHLLGLSARAQVAHGHLIEDGRGEGAYRAFAQAMELLRKRAAPAGARHRAVEQRFDDVVEYHRASFVGRETELRAIDLFLAAPERLIGVITAAPGLGKSALFAHLYERYGRLPAPSASPAEAAATRTGWIFHFSARSDERDHPVLGVRSLIAQCERQLEPLKGGNRPAIPWSYEDLVKRLAQALTELGQARAALGQPAVVVIDALDEQTPRLGGHAESIFGALPDELPPNVVALVSVRREPATGRTVGVGIDRARMVEIAGASPLRGLDRAALVTLLEQRLRVKAGDEVLDRIERAAAIATTTDAPPGRSLPPPRANLDPFYLRFLADGVRDGTLDLTDVGAVPEGLDRFFDEAWWSLPDDDDHLAARLLGMLAEMEGAGSDALFAQALSLPEERVARSRQAIQKLLVLVRAEGGEDTYRLFHDRFRWYVQQRFCERDRATELHGRLLAACVQRTRAANDYEVRWHTHHLRVLSTHPGLREDERAAHKQALWTLLFDPAFVQRKVESLGDERALSADFARGFDVFRPRPASLEIEVEAARRCTALARRNIQAVADGANAARAALPDRAREGDVMRVLQLAERAGGRALEWMTVLEAAVVMREAKLDPQPLFDAILAQRAGEPADVEPAPVEEDEATREKREEAEALARAAAEVEAEIARQSFGVGKSDVADWHARLAAATAEPTPAIESGAGTEQKDLTLHPEDRVLFEQLLTACVAPADVRAHILNAIPPIVDPPGEEERLIATIRSGEYVIALPPEESAGTDEEVDYATE